MKLDIKIHLTASFYFIVANISTHFCGAELNGVERLRLLGRSHPRYMQDRRLNSIYITQKLDVTDVTFSVHLNMRHSSRRIREEEDPIKDK